MKWSIVKRSIFARSIVLFLATILPVFITGLLAFHSVENKLLESYEMKVKREVFEYLSTLETGLQDIKHQQDTMINDDDFMYLMNKDTFNYYVGNAVNSMGTKLSLMGDSTSYLEESNVYFRSLNRRISLHNQKYRYLLPDFETMEGLMADPWHLAVQQYQGDLYVVTYPPMHRGDVNNLQYLIYSKISLDKVYDHVAKLAYTASSVSFLSFDTYNLTFNQMPGALFEKVRTTDFPLEEQTIMVPKK